MELLLGSIYLIVTVAVIYSMAVLLLQGEKIFSNKMYIACHVAVSIWCSSQILIMLSGTSSELFFTYIYGNAGICFAGAFWILFAASFNNQKPAWYFYLPIILSAIHYTIMITNNIHHMFYTVFSIDNVTHGLFFYTNVIETYIFIVTGTIILFKNVRADLSSNRNIRSTSKGTLLIILAVLIPLIFSILNISGLIVTHFDITPLGFSISVILVRTATARYQFFDMKKQLDIATEKLLIEKERNRIAQQVHDTTGHTLTLLQSYMKLSEVAITNNDIDSALDHTKEARSLASKGIKELRESINQLREEEENQLVTKGILQLAHQVKEIPCEVTIKGEDSEKYSYLSKTIYDTTRECITNTLKYANASRIDIVIKFKKDSIDLIIADDGIGCDEINDNNGLRGIKERIEKANGTVKFISSKNEGFMTRVTLRDVV